jgi:hypothetical protein
MGPSNPDPLHRAIARPGERSNVTITVRTARIIAVAQRMPRHRGGGGKGRNSGSSSTRLFSPRPPGQPLQGRVQATPPYI